MTLEKLLNFFYGPLRFSSSGNGNNTNTNLTGVLWKLQKQYYKSVSKILNNTLFIHNVQENTCMFIKIKYIIQEDFIHFKAWFCKYQFSSVTQWCLTLHNPVDCSTPGFPVLHQLLEFVQIHVYWVSDAIQPLCPLLSPSHCLQSFPASGSFQMSQFFTPGSQNIAVSASASVLPMNIQVDFLKD